jgi:putative ABC transport system substrate-binding protein
MTTHRAFIALCVSLAVLPLSAESNAQQRKVFRVGALNLTGTPSVCVDGWRAAMRELGYIEGDNIVFEIKYGTAQQLPALALELVRLNPDVIYSNSSPAVRAAIDLHSAVPIVALDLETDPVASGFASTLGHPGGNLTGLFLDLPEFGGKQLEILREALPALSHVIVLWDRSMDRAPLSGIETAARALHLRLSVREVDDDSALPAIFEDATARRVGAVIAMQSPRLFAYRFQIVKLAAEARLPVMGMFVNFAEAGALLSYGPNVVDMCSRPSEYVDRILKGMKPGDLPIQRPQKFDFVLNMRTAKALHLTIPQSILARADQVIR